jgi:hypothetical protein
MLIFVFIEEEDDRSALLRSVSRLQGNLPVEGELPHEVLRAFRDLVRGHAFPLDAAPAVESVPDAGSFRPAAGFRRSKESGFIQTAWSVSAF